MCRCTLPCCNQLVAALLTVSCQRVTRPALRPARLHAYTCWNTSSGARVNNYGSRIDHILVADWGASSGGDKGSRGGGGGSGGSGTQAVGCPPWVVAAVSFPMPVRHSSPGSSCNRMVQPCLQRLAHNYAAAMLAIRRSVPYWHVSNAPHTAPVSIRTRHRPRL